MENNKEENRKSWFTIVMEWGPYNSLEIFTRQKAIANDLFKEATLRKWFG